jgi:23S rRNA (pseudouridine1915-N3)-methyltransferase
MRLIIAAVGRLKDAERDLYARYGKRFDGAGRGLKLGPIELIEITESRAATAELRKADEADRLLKAVSAADVRLVLDEKGNALASQDIANLLATQRDAGNAALAVLIGGPDGHGEAALKAATLKVSLGAVTLPHGLARIVLTEQLYRAATILSGHPYHRA